MEKVAERILQSLISLMLLFTIVFFAIRSIPGDPAALMAGDMASESVITGIRAKLGLDQPIWIQYGRYLTRVGQLDLGQSIRSNRPVVQEIAGRFPATLLLATTATVMAAILGIVGGVLAARRKNSWIDVSITAGSVAGNSLPAFWVALILIDWLAVRQGLLPSSGAGTWKHLIMPAAVIAVTQVGVIARMTRTSIIEVLQADFIRTANAKGLLPRMVLWRHAFKNALIPTLTVMGLQLGLALGGAVITETVFSWPGIGRLIIDSVLSRDYPMIQGLVLFFGLSFIALNWAVDTANVLIDPRIRSR